jgi:S1-C subfamily serine protease
MTPIEGEHRRSPAPKIGLARRSARGLLCAALAASLACGAAPLHRFIGVACAASAAPVGQKRKALGFMAAPVPPGSKEVLKLARDRGMVVVAVTPGGIADRAGLQKGDVLLAIDGRSVASQADLDAALNAAQPSREAVAEVSRLGEIRSIAFGL